jgi:hypothetical protein
MKPVLFSIVIALLFSFTHATADKKAGAEVERINNCYVFIHSKPTAEYEYLGTTKISFVVSGSFAEVRDKLLKKMRRDFPAADGAIFHFSDRVDAIKFK